MWLVFVVRRAMMNFSVRFLSVVVLLPVLPSLALAQADYSAGKTAPQLFASDCSACHRGPQGLANGRDAYTLTGFLREHYTTKVESAGLLANYLVGVGGRPQPAARSQQPAPSTAERTRPPGSIEGDTAARERAKPGARAKLPPAEESTKAAAEALQSKLRSYATAGEEAKIKPGASEINVPTTLTAPAAAVPPGGHSSIAQESKPDSGASSSGVVAPAASEPSAPATPLGEKPPTPPPG